MMLAKLARQIRSVVSRAVVNSGNTLYQVLWQDDRVSADVEYFQPQGLHARVPAEATGALLAPNANKSASVLLCASGAVPTDSIDAGECGLHYLGEWRVFVDADGSVRLTERDPSDFAALASKVDQQLGDLKSALNAWTPVPNDGGAALKVAIATFAASASAVGSTKVKIS
jgi:phage gp45-like